MHTRHAPSRMDETSRGLVHVKCVCRFHLESIAMYECIRQKHLVLAFGILSIYIIDFSINAGMLAVLYRLRNLKWNVQSWPWIARS